MKTIKHSKQRDAILTTLRGTKSHPTAEWIYNEVKKELPSISLATIYRNLKLLLSMNEIICFNISGTEHYDADCSLHYHFICKSCGMIIDIPGFPINELDKLIYSDDMTIDGYTLEFYGTCNNCKKEANSF